MLYQNESVFMNLSKYFWKLYEHSEAKSGQFYKVSLLNVRVPENEYEYYMIIGLKTQIRIWKLKRFGTC